MEWRQITVEVPAESAEAASAILLEAGCHGLVEHGQNPRTLTGHLMADEATPEKIDHLEDRLADLPRWGLSAPLNVTIETAQDEDWANAWKKHFKPLEVGKRLVIKPTWEAYDGDPDRLVVELDPGMAFGTGSHPTTRLCLEALERCVRPGDVVADVGTGSGILAIAAARLGAGTVHATDIDLLPRQAARENVERNGLGAIIHVEEMDEFDATARECDVVVANIIALTIIELLPSMRRRLKPGGIFIASGIVDERLGEVLDAVRANDLQVMETAAEEVWRAVVARA